MPAKANTLKDVKAQAFICAFAAHLKKSGKIVFPKHYDLMKTAIHKECTPLDDDWYYIRTAAVARRIYLRKGCGVGGLARGFGGPGSDGLKRQHFRPAGRGVIRHCIHTLESLGLIEANQDGGRKVSNKGLKEMDSVAAHIN